MSTTWSLILVVPSSNREGWKRNMFYKNIMEVENLFHILIIRSGLDKRYLLGINCGDMGVN